MARCTGECLRVLGSGTVLLAVVVAVGTSIASDPSADPRDLRRFPPRVASLALQPIASHPHVARLTVRYEDDRALAPRITLRLGEALVTLEARARAGHRRRAYKGAIPFDGAVFAERQRDLDRLAQRRGAPLATPEFAGRQLLRRHPLPRLPLRELEAHQPVGLSPYFASPDEIDDRASLVVTATGVVQDPSRTWDPCTGQGTTLGVWTFARAMQSLATAAGASDAAQFTLDWITTFKTSQTVGSLAVPPRAASEVDRLLHAWPRQTGDPAKLDLERAPFRLLAIVNRIDLADNLVYGSGAGSGGEGRLVFGAVVPPATPSATSACVRLRMTVIFEYAIHKSSACGDLFVWATQWKALATHPLGSPAYNTALQALTDEFTSGGNGLAQLRTNELVFADPHEVDPPWEMREFHLGVGTLAPATVRRTPIATLNGTAAVTTFVNANATDILADAHDVPPAFPGPAPFLGAFARTKIDTFWSGAPPGSILQPDARHHFSLNTCSGCHARETGTVFAHVNPLADLDSPALLSGFVRGTVPGTTMPFTVTDPETGAVRTFDDLQRRRQKLAELASPICLFDILHIPLTTPH